MSSGRGQDSGDRDHYFAHPDRVRFLIDTKYAGRVTPGHTRAASLAAELAQVTEALTHGKLARCGRRSHGRVYLPADTVVICDCGATLGNDADRADHFAQTGHRDGTIARHP